MKRQSLYSLLAVSLWALTLAGCHSDSNPLTYKTQAEISQSANFLFKASQHAERALGIKGPLGHPAGNQYGICMESAKPVNKAACQNVYKQMLQYAKQTSGYQSLTPSELEDSAMFAAVKHAYTGIFFMHN